MSHIAKWRRYWRPGAWVKLPCNNARAIDAAIDGCRGDDIAIKGDGQIIADMFTGKISKAADGSTLHLKIDDDLTGLRVCPNADL